MPSKKAVAHAWHKLDCSSVAFEREDSETCTPVRCLMADSSLKLYNYLCCRESRVDVPNASGAAVARSWDKQELQSMFRSSSYGGNAEL